MKHPAKFSDNLLDVIDEWLEGAEGILLDPFAGTGKVHRLATSKLYTVGVELEPEWAELHPRTIIGNSHGKLPFRDNSIDYIVTSPVYGNRMSDHHEAKDASYRNTYRHTIGRPLHPANSGQLQWGEKYKDFHIKCWWEVTRVTKPDASFILNTSDHIRKGELQPVTNWHQKVLEFFGWEIKTSQDCTTRRNRAGANSQIRPSSENLTHFVRPA